ncbi:hypothetical protein NDU88_006274 [Pleurodeles waltl]|uniref:Uncharacterized protein n=1 Tax=Pleurodeles waltl TaxID=8319 RepID=A0AAV7UKK6_PLEWA|nr:hypothetical protein NDU88_006274 [Pleurodeles waltl]
MGTIKRCKIEENKAWQCKEFCICKMVNNFPFTVASFLEGLHKSVTSPWAPRFPEDLRFSLTHIKWLCMADERISERKGIFDHRSVSPASSALWGEAVNLAQQREPSCHVSLTAVTACTGPRARVRGYPSVAFRGHLLGCPFYRNLVLTDFGSVG